jgi:magnesium transporter
MFFLLYLEDMADLNQPVHQYVNPVETVILAASTVDEALASLRKKKIPQQIIYIYVVDDQHRLKGVVSTRQLLLAHPEKKIEEIMIQNVVKIYAHEKMKNALALFVENALLALPVVDAKETLLGMIEIQKVTEEKIDVASARGRADIVQMIGFTLEEGKKTSLARSYRLRMPWLLCNVFSGIICAIISRLYETVLAQHLLLAFFIPLVLTLSESSSMQSMAQTLQFLRRPRFLWKSAIKKGIQEGKLIALLAFSCACLVGILSLLWKGGFPASLTIGVGIFGSVAFSALFGLCIPVFLHRFRLDPKVASGPVVLMIADMLTTALYLSLATWWLL